jgi:glycolate oxidase iron-sulfur subunit
MSRTRDWLNDQGHWTYTLAEKFLLNSLRKGDTGIKRISQLASIYQRSPLRRVLRGSGLLRVTGLEKTDAEMPAFADVQDLDKNYPAIGTEKGRVSLFKGCLQNQTDPDTLPAAIKLLTHLGYSVELPTDQNCCGGLHLHSGEHEEAEHLARKNAKVFENAQTIVGVASGCGAVIKQYGELIGKDGESPARAYRDITAFLTETDALDSAEILPLSAKALVHEPCSHRNQLKQGKQVYEILGKIPGLEIDALPDNQFCCGGAGSYSLSEPGLASQMREPKLDAIAELRPDYLITTNIGCALHLKSGLTARGIKVELLHPVTLLARQLRVSELDTSDSCAESPTADMV